MVVRGNGIVSNHEGLKLGARAGVGGKVEFSLKRIEYHVNTTFNRYVNGTINKQFD